MEVDLKLRESVKEAIRKAGKNGGYICMSSNTIHAKVNPNKYVEMVKAVRDYGRYPLEDHINNMILPGSN